jgi:Arc/MetJ-type ribon-helix-helix transcriptional regulator
MGETVTIRLDAKMGRSLRELVRRRKSTKSAVIKNALRNELKNSANEQHQSAWEVYSRLLPKLEPPPPGPKRDRARNASRVLKEILVAKRRAGTL